MIDFPGGVYPLLSAIGHVLDDKKFRKRHGEDAHGWFDAARLCSLLHEHAPEYAALDVEQLHELYSTLNTAKQRMELRDGRVRARFPRTFHGELPQRPPLENVPALLYHSAAREDASRFLHGGIIPQRGSTVPLAESVDDAQARAISRTRDEETILIVDTAVALAAGVKFVIVNDDQYLADWVPAPALRVWVEQPIDPPVVSLAEAFAIAEAILRAGTSDYELELVGPVERPRHWVWGYRAVDPEVLLAGQSSIAVSKLDGRVRRLWSGRSIEAQL